MGDRTPHTQLVVVIVLFVLFASAASASADLSFGSPGSGAGQTDHPEGVAIDTSTAEPSSGHVYVADANNNRIDVFDSSGAFLFAFGWKVNAAAPEEKLQTCTTATGCQAGTSGSGVGQLSSPRAIAVDSSSHAVYVAEAASSRVEKFDSGGHFLLMFGKGVNTGTSGKANLCTNAGPPTDVCGAGGEGSGLGEFNSIRGVGIGPGGTVYVADTKAKGACSPFNEEFNKRVQKFNSLGEPIEQVEPTDSPCGRVTALAVGPTGDFYFASDNVTGAVHKYDPTGNPVTSWGESGKVDSSFNINALAVDLAGDLFVADNTELTSASTILEYDPTGAQLRAFYGSGSIKGSSTGLAPFHTAAGDLFVSQPSGIVQIPFPPPGPLTLPGSTEATEIDNSKATLKAGVNPEGKATEYRFQYVDDATFQADQPNGFEHAQETPFEAIPGPGGSSFSLQSVTKKLPLATLAPETTYHLRIMAKNADAPTGNAGEESTFTTLGPPEVLDTWATEVGSDSARLHAQVNPLELATTGYFQYVDDATYKADVGALGAGHGFDHAAASPEVPGGSAPLDFGDGKGGIARSAQAYPLSPGTTYHFRLVAEDPFAPVLGPERLLRTFSLSGANDTECPNQAFRTGPSAALPDCRAYEMVSPLNKNNGDIRTLFNFTGYPTFLDQSSNDGSGFTYSSYRAFANPQSAPYTNQYLAKRDPEAGWQSESIDPPQSGGTFRLELDNEYKAFSADLSSAWMLQEAEPTLDPCAPEGFADIYRHDNASGVFRALSCAQPNLAPQSFMPELEGFSTDGAMAVFRINDELAVSAGPSASGAGNAQVYLSTGSGELRLISVLPNGEASEKDSSAGTALDNELANHNRFQSVLHAVSDDGERVFWTAGTSSGQIYLRENATAEQSASGACDEAGKACTIAISAGEPAFFQKANPEGTKALFTVTTGPNQGNLYEFAAEEEQAHLIASGVLGSILGASEDLSRVSFVSKEASAQAQAEGAVKGEPNIYFYDAGATRFIGTLSSAGPENDLNSQFGSPISTTPIFRTARVSANGQSLVFMSNSRELSEETAGYDNTDAKSSLSDAEVFLYDAIANSGAGKLRCVSCNPSGARPEGREIERGFNGKVGPFGAATIPRFQTQFHQPRYLSDDGKLVFFNSFEALVIGDTNGKEDVYQWEAPGAGKCSAQSPSYLPSSEGCLSLISSGQSSNDSEFLDATPTGSDAFFTTAGGLLPSDYGLIDVYDARANGGFAPPPPPPPPCEGDACQSPVVPPNDPTPSSSSFEGAGDLAKKRSSRCPAGKRKVRKAGKSRCVASQKAKKRNRKQKHNHRRVAR